MRNLSTEEITAAGMSALTNVIRRNGGSVTFTSEEIRATGVLRVQQDEEGNVTFWIDDARTDN